MGAYDQLAELGFVLNKLARGVARRNDMVAVGWESRGDDDELPGRAESRPRATEPKQPVARPPSTRISRPAPSSPNVSEFRGSEIRD